MIFKNLGLNDEIMNNNLGKFPNLSNIRHVTILYLRQRSTLKSCFLGFLRMSTSLKFNSAAYATFDNKYKGRLTFSMIPRSQLYLIEDIAFSSG